jgi:L-rhamnose mutarotase
MSNIRAKLAAELHSAARVNYPTRRYELKNENDLYQSDLIEMGSLSKFNKGYRYILVVINCFTKYAYCIPLKNKTAQSVYNALEPIICKNRHMRFFQTDGGKEYFNKHVKDLLDKYNIKHYSVFTDKKASIAERFNRTIKSKIYRSLTERGSKNWVNNLQNIVDDYNNTVHSSIGMRPKDVTKKHRKRVLESLNSAFNRRFKLKVLKPKYKLGDIVRISKKKQIFDKKYLMNWSSEYFRIVSIHPTRPITYSLEDLSGEIIQGRFYQEEIKKTHLNESERNVYLIEKILRQDKDKLLVKWIGFPQPSFINRENLLE